MEINEKILEFARNTKTPFMLFDLDILEYNYNRLKKSMNGSEIFYAVKSNSHRRVLKRLVELGSSFDVASVGELELVLSLGALPENISYGNPIKKPEDIKFAYEKGVRLFVADEFIEVDKIAENAPGSLFFVRLEIVDSDSDWPLSKKFGTNVDKAKEILKYSKAKGLIPYGVSFHVGS
jgi:ornithine decarboxylase